MKIIGKAFVLWLVEVIVEAYFEALLSEILNCFKVFWIDIQMLFKYLKKISKKIYYSKTELN